MNWESFCEWCYSTWKSFCDFWVSNQDGSMNNVARVFIAILVAFVGHQIIKMIFSLIRKSALKKESKLSDDEKTYGQFSINLIRLLCYIILTYAVLRIINFDTTTLAGVLSAGTVAIGLSLQEIIKSFASGIILLRSKNMRVGEYVGTQTSYGNFEGTVVSIGLLQTTLLTAQGQVVTVNNNLVQSGVSTNFTRNKIRRLDVTVGVDYGTDVKLCKKALMNVLKNYGTYLQDKELQVMLTDLGEYYIEFTLRGWTKNEDYWDTRLNVREAIFEELKKNDIQIPFKRIVVEEFKK